jgi:cytochrome c peroxidase
MAYEATLIPDDTPMDRYLLGQNRALTPNQQRGLKIFNGKAHCYECHSGPELSDSSYTYLFREGPTNDDGADQGFHNLGVRPTEEDLGRAYAGPGGASFARSNSIYNRGAFKTPMLRNIKLTAPYFHNGGKATLEEVVDFYARGGDFANPELTSKLEKFSLGAQEKAQLVDFLRHGFTDCRVEKQRAPFDHPSLPLPNGPLLRETGAQGLGFCL